MKVGVPYDSTKYIENAIQEVTHTLAETLLIVIVVIFLFLGSCVRSSSRWWPFRCRWSARRS